MKHDKKKLQQHVKKLIEKRKPFSGTGQGFGTGAGKKFGTRNKVPHKVREAIAAADEILKDPKGLQEAIRTLTALGLLAPDTFEQVKQQAPRFIPKNGLPGVELIKAQREPTIEELAEFAKLPLDSLKRFKQKKTPLYADLRERFMLSRMSKGEKRVFEAIRDKKVQDSYEQVTGIKARPPAGKSRLACPIQDLSGGEPLAPSSAAHVGAPRIVKG